MDKTFGKLVDGSPCSSITVAPFTKVCDFPEPGGTTPLTLEVPVPHFALPVPPTECACFTFTSEEVEGDIEVIPNCNNENGTVSCKIEIAPVTGTDCCDGSYKITPTIDVSVPCVPFDLGEADITVHNKSGNEANGTDGGVNSLSIDRGDGDDCCTLKPSIDITFPDCIKHKPDSISKDPDGVQVTCCERTEGGGVTTKNVKDFITLKHDPDSCTYYPEVGKLEIPCCTLADDSKSGTIRGEDPETYINWTLERIDCDYNLAFEPHIPCKCLSFSGGTATADPDSDCSEASISIAIEKIGDDCCDAAYKITPSICVPKCTMDNLETSGKFETGNGGYVNWTFSMNDCVPSIEFDAHPKNIGVYIPCMPSVDTGEQYLNYSFTNSDGDTETTTTGEEGSDDTRGATFSFTKNTDPHTGCCTYRMNIGALDLTGIGGNIKNGGGIFQRKRGPGGGTLDIDGTTGSGTWWWGGGYGDRTVSAPGNAFQRGPSMGTTLGVTSDTPIPIDDTIEPFLNDDARQQAVIWRSNRKTKIVVSGESSSEEEDVESWFPDTGVATGNLSVMIPTGVQWHPRGVAAVMSQFTYNPSGVLSFMTKRQFDKNNVATNGTAVLLSPAPSVKTDDKTKFAGGIRVITKDKDGQSTGLAINDGRGLRIHGITKNSTLESESDSGSGGSGGGTGGTGDTGDTGDTGSGDSGDTGDPTADAAAIRFNAMASVRTADIGKLEIYTKETDIAFQTDGRLAINDSLGEDGMVWPGVGYDDDFNIVIDKYQRGGDQEYVIPVMTPAHEPSYYEQYDDGYYPTVYDIVESYIEQYQVDQEVYNLFAAVDAIAAWISTLNMMYMHVARSGVVLGFDADMDEYSGPRYAAN